MPRGICQLWRELLTPGSPLAMVDTSHRLVMGLPTSVTSGAPEIRRAEQSCWRSSVPFLAKTREQRQPSQLGSRESPQGRLLMFNVFMLPFLQIAQGSIYGSFPPPTLTTAKPTNGIWSKGIQEALRQSRDLNPVRPGLQAPPEPRNHPVSFIRTIGPHCILARAPLSAR